LFFLSKSIHFCWKLFIKVMLSNKIISTAQLQITMVTFTIVTVAMVTVATVLLKRLN